MGIFRWLQKRGSTGSIARWTAARLGEARHSQPDASDADICQAILAGRFQTLPMKPAERETFDRLLRLHGSPTDPRALAHFIWEVEIGSQLESTSLEDSQARQCREILDEELERLGAFSQRRQEASSRPTTTCADRPAPRISPTAKQTATENLSETAAKPEFSNDLVKKMFQVATELGEKAVDRYRSDVAALGYTPEIEGELCARILGEATAAVAHNSEFGLNDWHRAAPSIVGHAITSTLDPNRADPRMPPPYFYGYGAHVMELIERTDPSGLSHAYQSALANSCGGTAFLERVQSRDELKSRVVQMSAAFAADLLSFWLLSAHMRIHG